MYDLVCLGASWGGLQAIGRILADLPPSSTCRSRSPSTAIATRRTGTLAQLLQLQTKRPVLDVDDKMPIEPHHVYVAPPNYHLLVERGSFALSVDERVQFARPSIDVLFETAAHAYRAGVIGIILTGANRTELSGWRGSRAPAAWRDPGSTRRGAPDDAGCRHRRDRGRRDSAAGGDREVHLRAVVSADPRRPAGEAARPRGGHAEGTGRFLARNGIVDDQHPARRRPPREPAGAGGHPRAARPASPLRPLRRGGAPPAPPARDRGHPARCPDARPRRLRDGDADQAARAHKSSRSFSSPRSRRTRTTSSAATRLARSTTSSNRSTPTSSARRSLSSSSCTRRRNSSDDRRSC